MVRAGQRAPLFEQVMVQLAQLIRRGRLRPGDRLPPERELARRLHVSRATVREALRVMQLQGLIESRHGAGNFTAAGKAEELALALNHLALNDIFECRMLIEPAIAALAAQRAGDEDLERLEHILLEQADKVARQQSTVKLDIQFHSTLAAATHNHALQQMGAELIKVLAPSRQRSLQSPQRAQFSLLSHQRILGAIKARNPADARFAMEEHIRLVDMALFGLPAESIGIPFSMERSRAESVMRD